MSYEFLSASISMGGLTPKETYLADFQQILNEEFKNTFDWSTIQEETYSGSGVFQNVDVRINRAIAAATSEKLGDDFKQILFQDITHPAPRGMFYQFDNNYWLAINTEIYKNLAASVIVRRCNNSLRWMDALGALHNVPCIIENYAIRENRNYATASSAIVLPSGFVDVLTQLNPETNSVIPNQRFLIGNPGNWTAYKVLGGGINNYNNLTTYGDSTTGTLKLSLEVSYDNKDSDDLVNGIASAKHYVYTIEFPKSTVTGIVTRSFQQLPIVKLNGEIVERNVTWSSNRPSVASVSSQGVVSFLTEGTCTITATLAGNSLIKGSFDLTVVRETADNYEIMVTPNKNYILEGRTETFNTVLYLNDVAQADYFTFAIENADVPPNNYEFNVIDRNNFSVRNIKMYLNKPLLVTCTSGTNETTVEILLKGSW